MSDSIWASIPRLGPDTVEPGLKPRILIVDDSPENIRLLAGILKDSYDIAVATSGEQALKRVESPPLPDLILLDIVMPGIDGYEVIAALKAGEETREIPVLFLSALDSEKSESKGLELGALDYITKPFSPSIVKMRIGNHLELKRHRDHLEEIVRERTRELTLTQAVTFTSLGTLAEFRDPETGNHIQRTAEYVLSIARNLSTKPGFEGILSSAMIDRLAQSAPLHDIGKVGIPDSILLKPGSLSSEEALVMRRHAYLGFRALKQASELLGSNSFLDIAMDVAYCHHERWDGSGYPRGLAGESIPIAGRIMALADVYDALRSKRPYKSPFSHEKSLKILMEMRSFFDPRVLSAALECADELLAISERLMDKEEPSPAVEPD
ncbi:MAG TPA: HD domain-containing phosphohydrolase [Rectinemataceae bacterium]|nr:HD domain-containing phosphohydrolase [Rectinemataceae bacterium]